MPPNLPRGLSGARALQSHRTEHAVSLGLGEGNEGAVLVQGEAHLSGSQSPAMYSLKHSRQQGRCQPEAGNGPVPAGK